MKLKVQHVFDATQLLAKIIAEKRPLPGKGPYRVSRMHAKLTPEFDTINSQRTAKIVSYGHTAWADANGRIFSAEDAATMAGVTEQAAVPDDQMPAFVAWWQELAKEEIDVDIDPIPLDYLCAAGVEGSITAADFVVLGDLVSE